MTTLSIGVLCMALLWGAYLWWRSRYWEAPLVVILSCVLIWLVGLTSLGKPRPTTHDLFAKSKFSVIAHTLDEPRAIYVWVMDGEPMAFKLPWDKKQAQELHKASQQAKKHGGEVKMTRKPYGKWEFNAPPPNPFPPKDAQ